ncbi:MAG: SpoIIE family protein phosphatase [Planctomycetota bacterium]|jgi:sigma-B regulation protein RsbU (phosphoserine phosphatase)
MSEPQPCIYNIDKPLTGISLYHSLEVLADQTLATVILFDASNTVHLGPVAGNEFFAQILATDAGREAVISAHKSAINPDAAAKDDSCPLTDGTFEHFAIPITRNEQHVGTLTLGDRTGTALSKQQINQIETYIDLPAGSLAQAAKDLQPWSEAIASSSRNMTALLAELLAELCSQDEDLNLRTEELTAVYNISNMLAGTLDLQEILNKTARIVCEVMKVKACSIRMLDESSGVLTIKAVHNLSYEYLDKGPVLVGENSIDADALAGEMVYIADGPHDPRTRYPEQAKKEGIVSGLVCGLIYRGRAVGVLRVYTGEPHSFTSLEESLLRAVAAQAAAATVNAQLLAETLEAERYSQQLTYAGEVQRRMFPAAAPENEYLQIGAVYRPTYEVGGDFYDFISLPNHNIGLAIADVSGKGVPASLLMASLRSALRVNVHHTYNIDHIMTEVNQHVCRDTTIAEFATLFYGVLTPDGKRLTYCNAGHHPPMLLRDGKIQYLSTGGMVLGVDCDTTFERELIDLRKGDVLLLYTDGAVDAMNFNDETFGSKRLIDSLIRYADNDAQLMAKNILWDIRRFRGLADRTDDVTMVTLKIK